MSIPPNLHEQLLDEDRLEEAYKIFSRYFYVRFVRLFIRLSKNKMPQFEAEDLAEECIQEIVWRKVRQYRPSDTGSFSSWVFRVAEHMWVDRVRKRSKETNEMAVPVPNEAVERAVLRALEVLSDKERIIIERIYLSGEEYASPQIAAELGIPPGSVRVTHKRALEKLEAILKEDSEIAGMVKLN